MTLPFLLAEHIVSSFNILAEQEIAVDATLKVSGIFQVYVDHQYAMVSMSLDCVL